MTTPRNGLPEFWTTSLAKVLVGDQSCYLEPWLKAHYKIDKRSRDESNLAIWKANHSALLRSAVEQFQAEGWRCTVEQYFKAKGTRANVAGKSDLILQKADQRPVIVDVKSGDPKDSDIAQVMVEMILIPMAWEKRMIFSGLVIYQTHNVPIAADDAEKLKPRLFALITKLALMDRPEPTPSQSACRFCEVVEADCPARWKDDEQPQEAAVTDLF